MESTERVTIICERLEKKFAPTHLQVIDDSHHHVGHPGAQGGAGHYTIEIQADILQKLTRLEAHREIYSVLNDLIPNEIHALQIKLRYPAIF